MKHIKEYNDYSHLEDEYGDMDTFQTHKPKKRAKTHRKKKFNDKVKASKKVSEYTGKDLLSRYSTSESDWRVIWNHNDKHDIIDRIVNRSSHDVPYINSKVEKMIDYIERKWKHFETGNYIFTLRNSKVKIAIELTKFQRKLFITTILDKEMKNFNDIISDVIINESNKKVEILKEITLFLD
jgi:hypothetical protein